MIHKNKKIEQMNIWRYVALGGGSEGPAGPAGSKAE
jgi:hypothetical protein